MKEEITCPKCFHAFAADEAVRRELEVELRKQISGELEGRHAAERTRLEQQASEQAARALAELQAKVDAQARELRDARSQELALLRAKAELQERADKARLEAERQLAHEREAIREAARQQVLEQHQLRDADKDKQLETLRQQIEQLKQKAEQGSQQLQGEVQEIELEKALREQFPKDQIDPVKTGARGADILQKVTSDDGKLCGTILWESKRVRNWNDAFIDKLLRDKSEAKADLAVLVIDALPDHIVHLGSVKGVLVTTFSLAICLAATLRVNLSLLGQTRLALTGQEDQKTRLFQYFLSPQFQEKINMMADQLQEMQEDLRREKAAITRTWNKRQEHLNMVMTGTAGLAGTLQAFYGSALPAMPQFELPAGGDE